MAQADEGTGLPQAGSVRWVALATIAGALYLLGGAAGLAGALAVPGIAVGGLLVATAVQARAHRRWVASVLRGPHGLASIGDLVEVIHLEPEAPADAHLAADALAGLLPAVDSTAFYSLPFKQRYSLCSLLSSTQSASLALGLIDLFDRAAYPVAVMCLSHVIEGRAHTSNVPEVWYRASGCHRTLTAALSNRRDAAVLLRASSPDPATLLRPMQHGPEPDEQLLRPAPVEASTHQPLADAPRPVEVSQG